MRRKSKPITKEVRNRKLCVNLSEEEYRKLDNYCKKHGESKAYITRISLQVVLDSLIRDDEYKKQKGKR